MSSTSWRTNKSKDKNTKSTSSLSFSDLKTSLKRNQKEEEKFPKGNDEEEDDLPTRKRMREDILGKREKKLSIFSRPSPDVNARSTKHDKHETRNQSSTSIKNPKDPSVSDDNIRLALERKAKLYDQLQRGKTAGLSEDKIQDSLIDWDRKEAERSSIDKEHDEDDKTFQNSNDDEDDPLTEYEDEFGRTRMVRRSEIPRDVQRFQRRKEEDRSDENMIIYGPSTSFPVYKPDPTLRAAQMAKINEKTTKGEYVRSNTDHFDSRSEIRYRGAGFYQFSQDEQTRKSQMNALRQDRQKTLQKRDEPQISKGKDTSHRDDDGK